MIEPLSLLTALLLGLFGSSHCLVMCGGISAAIGSRSGNNRLQTATLFNLGRLCSYTLLGAIVASLGLWLQSQHATLMLLLRTLAALMLILMGLYIARWSMLLTRLEQLGKPLWNLLQPLARRFIGSQKSSHQVFLGMLWGFLPCGLIYSTLAWVAANGNPALGAASMFAFGLGTMPALLVGTMAGMLITPWLNKPAIRTLSGLLLIAFGLWTMSVIHLHN